MDKIKVLLDTDIGGDIDDALALAYLLRELLCELLGITTVCAEASIRAEIAHAICATVDKRVPIAVGKDLPLQKIPLYPTPKGKGALAEWGQPSFKPASFDAAEFLYDIICTHPNEDILVGIGCMTNIATLFLTHPDVKALIKGLCVRNGYFGNAPLPHPYYNWNSWADHLASQIVCESTVPNHRVFPLDVTQTLTLHADAREQLLDQLLTHCNNPLLIAA